MLKQQGAAVRVSFGRCLEYAGFLGRDGRLQHIHYKRLNGWMAGSRAVKGSKEAFLGL